MARNHPPSHASALRTSIWWQSGILAVAPPPPASPAPATCVSRHFATPPRPRTTFVVGEMASAANCAAPASRRPRDSAENRHFFAPRHRQNGLRDRGKLKEKVRILLLLRFRRPQGTYWRQHIPYLKYLYSATPPFEIWVRHSAEHSSQSAEHSSRSAEH